MRMDKNTVTRVAGLAKLELTADEAEKAAEELGKIAEMLNELKNVNTDGMEPVSHVLPVCNVFREDSVQEWADSEALQQNAAQTKDGMFAVPKTVETE